MDTNQDGRIDSEDLHNALAKVQCLQYVLPEPPCAQGRVSHVVPCPPHPA